MLKPQKVILSGYIIVPETDLAAVVEELENHIELTLAEEGCMVFEVNRSGEDPARFEVYEEFRDEESFLKHQSRVRNSRWGVVAATAERNYKVQGLE